MTWRKVGLVHVWGDGMLLGGEEIAKETARAQVEGAFLCLHSSILRVQ